MNVKNSNVGNVVNNKHSSKWLLLSTRDSIAKDILSLTSIIESIISIPLYVWIAYQYSIFWSLLIAVIVAPLVLLQSEQSIALGLRWFARFERLQSGRLRKNKKPMKGYVIVLLAVDTIVIYLLYELMLYYNSFTMIYIVMLVFLPITLLVSQIILSYIGAQDNNPYGRLLTDLQGKNRDFASIYAKLFAFPLVIFWSLGIFHASVMIRIFTTLIYVRSGLKSLPRNFRRLIFCTSPFHTPELVPGLERSGSIYTFVKLRRSFVLSSSGGVGRIDRELLFLVMSLFLYIPAWLYRLTIKSTAWFWWPLAFLGSDLRLARNPKLLRWKIAGSLWAKTSIGMACVFLLLFCLFNLVFNGAIFRNNPLLSPIGYLLLVDWKLWPWQICILLASILGILLVYLVNDATGEHDIALDTGDKNLLTVAKRKFALIERFKRLQLVLLLVFWGLVGTHAVLYANSQQCWFTLSPVVQGWVNNVYGDRLPLSRCR